MIPIVLLTVATVIGQGPSGAPGGPGSGPSPEEVARLESKYLRNIRQITDEGQSGEGYFSPDGSKIIYQAIRGDHPFYQIYLRDLDSGTEKMVSTGYGRTTCAYFHPTLPKILYASSHLDPGRDAVVAEELARIEEERKNPTRRRGYSWAFDPHMDIFEANLDGSGLVRLTDAPGYDAEGSYSPDGKHVVFTSFRKGNGDLFIMDADGSNVRQLTDSPGYDGGPFFSPDGSRVIFRGEVRKRDYLQLFVLNADGTGERQLTDNDAVNWGPYWHPDGRHIIFSTSLHGHYNYELYLMDVDTGKIDRVTHAPGADVLPVFSPDGKRLMWTSKRGADRDGVNSSQLWMADWVMPDVSDDDSTSSDPTAETSP